MLEAKSRWIVSENNQEKVNVLAKELNIAPLIASLLVNRGFDTVESARLFLDKDNQEFHDPFLLEDMKLTVERIHQAISQNEKILVFGDYDADGVTSTTVMLTALREIGAIADFYIPNRFTEGYGPNESAFKWAKEQDFKVIITVDTGISALHEATVAKELGLDLIITDHHEPGPELPDAYAIIHPKKETCSYPFEDLAGVGVALKVAHALLGEVPDSLLEIAAIGTIADLVPLHGENRLIASKGIKRLPYTKRLGLKALLKVCGVEPSSITEETIGFALAPRINAVGRLESADPAVHLLLTNDSEEASMLASEIDQLNKERQQLVNEMTEEAIKEVEENFPPSENSVLVIAKEGWNAGVIGIVASRLVDRFYRPTIVLSIDPEKGVAKGSARSIVGFDLFANLSTCRDILPHFGGHPMAAGMTLEVNNINSLRERLNTLANEQLSDDDFIPVIKVDTVTTIEEISIESIQQLNELAPFGMNNPKPRILIEEVTLSSMRRIGSDQNHLKLTMESNGVNLDSVGFGFGDVHDHVSPLARVSVVGELSINEWNNFRKPQLMLHDISVKDWQLFDLRGVKNIKKTLQTLDQKKIKMVSFSKDTFSKLQLDEYQHCLSVITNEIDIEDIYTETDYVFILDLPHEKALLSNLFEKGFPSRIYAVFHNEQDHFFNTLPTREHFKWFYAYLSKKGAFDLNRYGEDLAKHKGWTKETIDFISQVFFELEFVKIDKGFISLSNLTTKKDLSESKTYQKKQQQFELENEFLYSSYQQLKQWFSDIPTNGSLKYEEAIK
ncbi:single-stranded-DNA-specific exonuclease RecJ [Bacillus timonensis]|nr:single-stranded-DNA-specific exonuclease RecJ [Bacillus timonensis]